MKQKQKQKRVNKTYKGKITATRKAELKKIGRARIKAVMVMLIFYFLLVSVGKLVQTYYFHIEELGNNIVAFTHSAQAKNQDTFLEDVLTGTEMEGAIPYIRKASKYYDIPQEVYVGLANAESSLNRFKCYNPWGIDTGRGNDPRCYSDWEHAVDGFSALIKYYYFNEGLNTPETIILKYVGWKNPYWVSNVRKYWNPEN